MAFCGNCGTQIQDSLKFCPSCGQATGAENIRQASPQVPIQQGYVPPVVPGAPGQAGIQDANDNKTMAWLAYLLFFIPLLTGAHKTSPFARYHTNQGTVLFIASAIYGVIYGILSFVLAFIPVVGWILILILGIASILFPIFCVVGIINAVNGKMQPLPIIGGITVIK